MRYMSNVRPRGWHAGSRIARQRIAWSAVALVTAAALARTGVMAAQANGLVTLRMKFKQGDVSKYKMNMQMTVSMRQSGQSQPMTIPVNMSIPMRQEVTRSYPNGGGEVRQTFLPGGTGQGADRLQNMPPMTTVYDARGRIQQVKGIPPGSPMSGMFGGGGLGANSMPGSDLFLPDHPVRPGDTWVATMKVPTMMGRLTAPVHSTLVTLESVGRYRSARIRSVVNAPINMYLNNQGRLTQQVSSAYGKATGAMSVTTDQDFAVVEGKLVRLSSAMTAAITMRPTRASMPSKPGMGTMPKSIEMNMKMNVGMDLIQ